MMSDKKLSEYAKTIVELNRGFEAWIKAFQDGATGNQIAYNFARDTRHLYYEFKWVPLEKTEALEAENAKLIQIIKQIENIYDEEDQDHIISAIETAQDIGIYLDDLEDLKATVSRLYDLLGVLLQFSSTAKSEVK